MQVFLGGRQDGFIVHPLDKRYLKLLEGIDSNANSICFLCVNCNRINCYNSLYIWAVHGKKSCVNCNHVVGPWPRLENNLTK